MRLRTLLTIVSIYSAASIIFGWPSEVSANSEFRFGNWSGGAFYNDKSGRLSHCAASAFYVTGDTLIFSLNPQGQFGIGVYNDKWNLRPGDKYPIAISVDRYPQIPGQAQAVS